MQRTINISGHKIKISTRRVTRQGNSMGTRVKVSDHKIKEEYFYRTLNDQEAMDKGYVRFVKDHC